MSCFCPQDWSRVLKRVSFLFKLICFKKQTFLAGVLAVDNKQLTLQWPYSSALTWGNTCTERVVSTGCELNKVSVTSCVPVQCVIITHSFSLRSKSFFFSSLCCSFPSMFPPNCRLSFLTFLSVCVFLSLCFLQEKEGRHPAQPGGPALLHHRRGPGENPCTQIHHSESSEQETSPRINVWNH